jgi:hypothetical protein
MDVAAVTLKTSKTFPAVQCRNLSHPVTSATRDEKRVRITRQFGNVCCLYSTYINFKKIEKINTYSFQSYSMCV